MRKVSEITKDIVYETMIFTTQIERRGINEPMRQSLRHNRLKSITIVPMPEQYFFAIS